MEIRKLFVIVVLTVILPLVVLTDSFADPWTPIGRPVEEAWIFDFTVKRQTIYAVTSSDSLSGCGVYMKENCLNEQSQWQNISDNMELDPQGELPRSIAVAVNPRHPDSVTIYVGTYLLCPKLWKSCDRGSTWTVCHEQMLQPYEVVVVDPKDWQKIWVATWPGLIVSEDGGDNWTSVDPPDYQYISSICYDPIDSLTVYVSTVGIESHYGSVFKTTDGGRHWEEKALGLPWPMDWTTMGADSKKSGILYLMPWVSSPQYDGISVYKTTNGGEFWARQIITEEGPHPPWGLAYILVNPCYPIVYFGICLPNGYPPSGYSGYLYKSCDQGSTWTTIIDEAVMGIVVDKEEPEKVYVVFEDGIWCYDDPMVVIEDSPEVTQRPESYALCQNYPNPFNPDTQINYQIPQAGHVILKIFNVMGQEVRSLLDAYQKPSRYAVIWDGRNEEGREVASGLYFCRFKAGDFSGTIKMVLLK